MRRALLFAFWLALASGAARADDAALHAVDTCRARLDARKDVGMERVRQRCPELLPALEKAPWRGLLPSTLGQRREEISAESLRALSELVRRSTDPAEGGVAPSRDALAPVLAELGERGRQGATRWERFKRWLKQKFSRREDEDKAGWLERWTRGLRTSEGVARAITYVGYALVAGMVLLVIWGELRAAGLFGARRAARRAGPAAEWRRRLMLGDVMEAPLAERPGMMLRLLGEALSRARRLPPSEGLTARALVTQARLDAEAQRAALAGVAEVSEQARFASHPPGDPQLEAAVVAARELLTTFARLPEAR